MNTLILSACSILAAGAASQSTPQVTLTAAMPRARVDAPRTLKITDLHDLLKSDVESPTIGMYTMSGRSPAATTPKDPDGHFLTKAVPKPGADDPEILAKSANAWEDMLAHWIRPALQAPQDTLQITRDGTLIANLTAEAHDWLDHFLTLQREPKSMVNLQVDFITGPNGTFDRYASGGTPRVISADDAKQLLAEAKTGGTMKRASSDQLFGWVRKWNKTSVLERSSYVKDWTITTVEPGHRKIAVPDIGTLEDGPSVGVRAVPLDATHVGLEIDAKLSTVKQPIATKTVKLDIDGGREVEIALPEVTQVTFKSQISLEYGGYALFSGVKDSEGTVAVLVHVEHRSDTSPPVMETTIMAAPRKKGSAPDKH